MKRNPDLERQILLTIEADTDDPMATVSLEGLDSLTQLLASQLLF